VSLNDDRWQNPSVILSEPKESIPNRSAASCVPLEIRRPPGDRIPLDDDERRRIDAGAISALCVCECECVCERSRARKAMCNWRTKSAVLVLQIMHVRLTQPNVSVS
jgi:hypothetical protein